MSFTHWSHLLEFFLQSLLILVSVLCALHALTRKRDPRSALGWVVVCLGFPGLGPLFYLLFGINRIQTRAKHWKQVGHWMGPDRRSQRTGADARPPFDETTIQSLLNISSAVSCQPLVSGCFIEILQGGDKAYPKMLEGIRSAQKSVYLSTYIFDMDETGRQFAEALENAHQHGVDVRVLVDGFGALYHWPTAKRVLRKKNVACELFLPFSFSKTLHFNLRNHRKLLMIDGQVGFTGGMNIGNRHVSTYQQRAKYAQDMHFMIRGPVVHQMMEVFWQDWKFVKDEEVTLQPYLGPQTGHAFCRGIAAGPNEELDPLRWIVKGVFAAAKKSVRLMTPYFVPDPAVISAINTAVLRGINVEVILPAKNNLFYVHWASRALLWELLKCGVKIYYQPPPFVHTKFLVLDDFYSLVGSANIDARSFRLNFEFNLEIFDHVTAMFLTRHFESAKEKSHLTTLKEIDARPLQIKVRDSLTKLFAPYL